jgi:uncharacterized protein
MNFNKITRGAARAIYDESAVWDILDGGFLCHVAFVVDAQTQIIPTTYGRLGETIYLHGSSKNGMLHAILQQEEVAFSVTHLDGLVAAKSLFDSSANYRSVVLMVKARLVNEQQEKVDALNAISEQIMPGRIHEVALGTAHQIDATWVIALDINAAAVKVRTGGPKGDEALESAYWSGHIPMKMTTELPIRAENCHMDLDWSPSLTAFMKRYK